MHIQLSDHNNGDYVAVIFDGDIVIETIIADLAGELGEKLMASPYADLPVACWGSAKAVYPAPGVTLAEMVEAVFQ